MLRTVYASDRYHFSCGSIKKCGIDEEMCKECAALKFEAKAVSLWQYDLAANMGSRIVVEADVIGRDNKSMLIPERIKGTCGFDPDKTACMSCPMSEYFNIEDGQCERTLTFDASNPQTVELSDSSGGWLSSLIKRIFGVADTRCEMFKYEVDWRNAQVIHCASRITNEFKIQDKVQRVHAIYLGHGIDLNTSYKLYGYVWSHPRTRASTFIVDDIERLESSLATFTLTSRDLDSLNIFKTGDVIEKVKDIHNHFINSFLYIFGREELLLGIDLVFHSVRRFVFQRQLIKGWLDILILGDTGQGKSEMCERLIKFYQLGVVAAGETSSRTGLLYTIQMLKNEEAWVAFGLLPRCNGYLVVVDEIHGMPAQDFREFTLVRSKGVVDVKRVAYGVAPAETRLISIANAKGGSGMSLLKYGYPVQAIIDIPCFSSLEDVRRFDYAIGLRAGDVAESVINQDVNLLDDKNPYTAELSRNLVLWVWTRKPEQVIFTPQVESYILERAKDISMEYIPDIPLVESADFRLKVARIATAFAGRVYNSPDGINLIVEKEHVDAACKFLDDVYKSPGLNYWGYSDDYARVQLDPEQEQAAKDRFKLQFMATYKKIAQYLLLTNEFNKTMMKSTDLDVQDIDRLVGFLLNARLMEPGKSSNYYRKTPQGRTFFYDLVHEDDKPKEAKEDDF